MSSGTARSLGYFSTAKQVIESFGEGQYLAGKTAIVTGGNTGIGLETCKALALAGARVILCSRSVAAGEKAVTSEIAAKGYGGYQVNPSNVVVKELDLSSLSSIKAFADNFLASEQRLDYLVLNAGIMALPRLERTEAGFEKQIGVNHFGHAYLVSLLKDRMLATPDTAGRIVVLSSTAHTMGSVVPSDLHYNKGRRYAGWEAYGQSKLANLLYAKGLADRLKGTPLTAVSVHPGVIRTNLWNASILNRIFGCLVSSKTIPQGAATTVFACVAPEVGTDAYRGAYLDNCGMGYPNSAGRDARLREELWEATENQLTAAVQSVTNPAHS